MRLSLLAFLLLFTTSTPAYAGAWVQPEGSGLFIAQASYYSTSTYFDTNGDEQAQPRFSKYELQPYIEYGASEWLTIGTSAYLQRVSQSDRTNFGIADPEFFARMRLYQDNAQVVSIQPLVKFASSFAENNAVRGGSKSTDIELSALYGRNLNLLSPRDYADVRIGYRQRDRGLSPQWRGDIAVGLGVTDSLHIVPALRTVVSTNLANATTFTEGGDIDHNILKAEVTGMYHLNATQWFQASIFSHVAGIQTGNGYGASVGFAQRF